MRPIARPNADAPDFPADAVEVGRIAGAFGVGGWIRVKPHARDPKALFASKQWFIASGERSGPVDERRTPARLRITAIKPHGDEVVAVASELGDRDAAQALRGAKVYVPRSSFPRAADDEYYWVDLIGLEVVNRDGQRLGQVTDLLDTGAHSVLVLRPSDAGADDSRSERLIPFVGAYIDSVDFESRRIVADWGLDY